MVFTIRNSGTANLTGLALTKAGTHPGDFLLSALGATTLAPGASTTFTVTFKPAATGVRSASLRIASNDADENPFDIALNGNGVPVPEIAVEQPVGTNLTDGIASTSFGNVNLGSSGTAVVFTVKNLGTANLSGLVISMVGANPADFKASALGATTLLPGASTTFSVTFQPTAGGSRSASLRIASNDADENPFDIALAGNGIPVPEIAVEQPVRTNLIDGVSKVVFANVNLGSSSVPSTFTIRNLGTANLTRLAITASGANPGDFLLGALGATTLAPGASTTFTVAFKPTSGGVRNAVLQVASNDADENPFDVSLTGSGVPVPEIAVENAAGTDLIDGAASASFGNVNRGSSSSEMVFTLRNLGTANLTGISVAKNGVAAADFVVSPLGQTTLAPGQSTSLRVTFKPLAAGTRNAGLLIYSNDANERPFDIALTGTSNATVLAASSASPAPLAAPEPAIDQPVTSVIWTGGMKYNSITIPKTAGTVADSNAVEVSPDLVNWFSGVNFTTVVVDNESILQVRDNTPLTPEVKRYIRLAVRY
jgi:uncharacterized cupredoxin-like copper-binding protein